MIKVGLFAYGEMGFPALQALTLQFQVLWVVIPTKETMIGTSLDSQAVRDLAVAKKIEIIDSNSEKKLAAKIEKSLPDVVVIASYNRILSNKVLNLTKFINVHHGDLPRYRGRANINWAIINGRSHIGLTIHEAVAGLDAGSVYAQYRIPITQEDTIKTVYDKVNIIVKKDIGKIIRKVMVGFKGKKQEGQATYCCTRLPEDGLIDWAKSSQEIYNLIRALTKPYPGAFSFYEGKKIIIWSAEIPKNAKIYEGSIAGRVCEVYKGIGVEVLTGEGQLIIKEVEYKGKIMNASELINSVQKTLGINWVQFFEQVQALLNK